MNVLRRAWRRWRRRQPHALIQRYRGAMVRYWCMVYTEQWRSQHWCHKRLRQLESAFLTLLRR